MRLEKTMQQIILQIYKEEEWEEKLFTSIVHSRNGSCKNIFHFNSVTIIQFSNYIQKILDYMRKDSRKQYVFELVGNMITSYLLAKFCSWQPKDSDFYFCLFPFFFRSAREKVNSWLSLGRSIILFSPVDKIMIFLKLWVCLLKQGEKERWQKPAAGFF